MQSSNLFLLLQNFPPEDILIINLLLFYLPQRLLKITDILHRIVINLLTGQHRLFQNPDALNLLFVPDHACQLPTSILKKNKLFMLSLHYLLVLPLFDLKLPDMCLR